jgi:hypothetical protein
LIFHRFGKLCESFFACTRQEVAKKNEEEELADAQYLEYLFPKVKKKTETLARRQKKFDSA